jgi:hypothetical protein
MVSKVFFGPIHKSVTLPFSRVWVRKNLRNLTALYKLLKLF